jgi:hypothetical protein
VKVDLDKAEVAVEMEKASLLNQVKKQLKNMVMRLFNKNCIGVIFFLVKYTPTMYRRKKHGSRKRYVAN